MGRPFSRCGWAECRADLSGPRWFRVSSLRSRYSIGNVVTRAVGPVSRQAPRRGGEGRAEGPSVVLICDDGHRGGVLPKRWRRVGVGPERGHSRQACNGPRPLQRVGQASDQATEEGRAGVAAPIDGQIPGRAPSTGAKRFTSHTQLQATTPTLPASPRPATPTLTGDSEPIKTPRRPDRRTIVEKLDRPAPHTCANTQPPPPTSTWPRKPAAPRIEAESGTRRAFRARPTILAGRELGHAVPWT